MPFKIGQKGEQPNRNTGRGRRRKRKRKERTGGEFLVTKISYHLTNLWEPRPNSPNDKITGSVCWG